ncbi:MAG TPA: hypothetical protein VFI60_05540 [Candidatus Acidoferrum sp.]|nr:hypothetical protein [Candidatus Acidoferrum sp.]
MTNNPSDALRCPDCDEAARHAYSDATTPGFFNPKCPKHQADVLRAAIRKACEDANENIIAALNGTTSIKHMGPAVFECIARCYERRLVPVFEALRISEIDECKAALCGYCRRGISVDAEGVHHHSYVQYGEAGERWDSKSHVKCPVLALDALKGAPR